MAFLSCIAPRKQLISSAVACRAAFPSKRQPKNWSTKAAAQILCRPVVKAATIAVLLWYVSQQPPTERWVIAGNGQLKSARCCFSPVNLKMLWLFFCCCRCCHLRCHVCCCYP